MLKNCQKLTRKINTIFIWKSLFLGFQGEEPVDLKITCPDQLALPGYSTIPLPSTTATSAITTSTINSEGSESRFATSTVTTTDSGFAADLGDEKASGDANFNALEFSYQRLSII